MQIKGKIFTIAGIVLIFGYFISESFKDPSDPTQVVMVGNDTLGRDWGAMAEQIEREKMQQQNGGVEEGIEALSGEMDESANTSLLDPSQDPLNRQKLDQNNYYSIESPDGREIITGYSRPEEQVADDEDRYKSRHQQELEEPQMIYRE
jgi:hypothetical protein